MRTPVVQHTDVMMTSSSAGNPSLYQPLLLDVYYIMTLLQEEEEEGEDVATSDG